MAKIKINNQTIVCDQIQCVNADDETKKVTFREVETPDRLDQYLAGTLKRMRINFTYPQGVLQPGASNRSYAPLTKTLERWEIPYLSGVDLAVWGYAQLTKLWLFDAGRATNIGNVSFNASFDTSRKCYLILRKDTSIVGAYSTSSTPTSTNFGIYVPKDLIPTYQADTKWSNRASLFHPVYITTTIQEKEQLIDSGTVESDAMIICDEDETYLVKEDNVWQILE